jgi:acetyl/propionyl-CoA carboxylase alpha subunit/acetyl-CoA carboxylase carboxyltransferase component
VVSRLRRLLVANRGEIAVRILRAAAAHGCETVAVHSTDDARCLHVARADRAVDLGAAGPKAYLDIERIAAVACEAGCDAVHPGYGFLSENSAFAMKLADADVTFVGPTPAQLALFGDKARARQMAEEHGVPVLAGLSRAVSLEEAKQFFSGLRRGQAMIVKALAGGGGRGMRIVREEREIEEALARCRSEAQAAFGCGDVYVERLLADARHIEVQVVGDGRGVVALGDRECSLQRRHQKLVEAAPSPRLDRRLRERLFDAAVRMAEACHYRSLATFEFLVDAEGAGDSEFFFIEANARLQVEHTVTEAVTGLDLVRLQLAIAGGASLEDLGLVRGEVPESRGSALQLRVNMETIARDGSVKPTGGTLAVFEPPAGPGVRVDTFGYAGYTTSPAFDSLLAKVIVHSDTNDFATLVATARRRLGEFRIEGVETNVGFLETLLAQEEVAAARMTTRFLDEHAARIVDAASHASRRSFFAASPVPASAASARPATVGVRVDAVDPLAVVRHGKGASAEATVAATATPTSTPAVQEIDAPAGTFAVRAPIQGTVVSLAIAEGEAVAEGAALLVMEAMKMEHVVSAPASGRCRGVAVAPGDTVFEGHALVFLEEADVAGDTRASGAAVDPDHIRPDLAEAIERHRFGLDAARPEAIAKRRASGQRTARENVDDLCDPGTFSEFGALVIAAQRRRRGVDDLIRRTPGDGMICGLAHVNGSSFGPERSRAVVMSYDYSVLAGTQGLQNHRKKDRMFEIAYEQKLPVVILTEGGGGRPGDTDGVGVAGLDCRAFQFFGKLSGLVPLVGINSGRCFAGNAALLGCCDVVIATENSSIGMGGPAMIEGGGLGVFHPDEVGPMSVQTRNGVVDIAVRDEAEAIAVAKQYLSYFQGPLEKWSAPDQRLLRSVIPENRLRIYDVRRVLDTLVDEGSLLELRRDFAAGMITALARVEGRPLGIVANNPAYLAGAIDPDGADKAARFMQLCDAHDLPLLFLCDTPGIMVGPEIEKRAMVRHASRMFVVGASLTVPFFTIVLRKGYGLGAQAMAGGSFHAPIFTVAWPTAEFGGMGLEGAVKLGFQKELEAVADPAERRKLFDEMVARMYELGKGVSMASYFEIDDVIDPVDSRRWIMSALTSAPPPPPRAGKKRPCVDTW